MKQGDVYLVSLDSVIGSEQAKTRPCIIVSTNIVNDFASTVTVIPISTKRRKKPMFCHVYLDTEKIAKVEHIRTVDKVRLRKHLGNVSTALLNQIKRTLKIYLDIC